MIRPGTLVRIKNANALPSLLAEDFFWAIRSWREPAEELVDLRIKHGECDPRFCTTENRLDEISITIFNNIAFNLLLENDCLGIVVSRFSTPEMLKRNWAWTLVFFPAILAVETKSRLHWLLDDFLLEVV